MTEGFQGLPRLGPGLEPRANLAALEIFKAAPIYICLAAALWLARTPQRRAIVASLAVAFTCGELIVRNAASNLNAEPRSAYALLEGASEAASLVTAVIRQDTIKNGAPGERPRVEIVGLGGPWQNAAMVLGLEVTNGYNPLRIGSYDRLVSPGESPFVSQHRHFPASFPGYNCNLSRLLGLQYVVLDRPIEAMPHLKQKPVADTLLAGPDIWLYRLRGSSARVSLRNRVEIADIDGLIEAGVFPENAESTQALMEDSDKLTQKYTGVLGHRPGRAEIINWRPDRIEIEVESASPAILTLHDPWYPGWQVEVDGERAPLLRSSVLFRGVEIPAGAKQVVFTFRPLSLENLQAAGRSALGLDD